MEKEGERKIKTNLVRKNQIGEWLNEEKKKRKKSPIKKNVHKQIIDATHTQPTVSSLS